jgi:serine/threonine protein kinase
LGLVVTLAPVSFVHAACLAAKAEAQPQLSVDSESIAAAVSVKSATAAMQQLYFVVNGCAVHTVDIATPGVPTSRRANSLTVAAVAGSATSRGMVDGSGAAARFFAISAIAPLGSNTTTEVLYAVDATALRRIAVDRLRGISTVATVALAPAMDAVAVAMTAAANETGLLAVQQAAHCVQLIDVAAGTTSTFAGICGQERGSSGTYRAYYLKRPSAVTRARGTVFVADVEGLYRVVDDGSAARRMSQIIAFASAAAAISLPPAEVTFMAAPFSSAVTASDDIVFALTTKATTTSLKTCALYFVSGNHSVLMTDAVCDPLVVVALGVDDMLYATADVRSVLWSVGPRCSAGVAATTTAPATGTDVPSESVGPALGPLPPTGTASNTPVPDPGNNGSKPSTTVVVLAFAVLGVLCLALIAVVAVIFLRSQRRRARLLREQAERDAENSDAGDGNADGKRSIGSDADGNAIGRPPRAPDVPRSAVQTRRSNQPLQRTASDVAMSRADIARADIARAEQMANGNVQTPLPIGGGLPPLAMSGGSIGGNSRREMNNSESVGKGGIVSEGSHVRLELEQSSSSAPADVELVTPRLRSSSLSQHDHGRGHPAFSTEDCSENGSVSSVFDHRNMGSMQLALSKSRQSNVTPPMNMSGSQGLLMSRLLVSGFADADVRAVVDRHNSRCEAVAKGEYQKGKLIGRGAYGSVFAAMLDDGSTVAVKVMNLTGEPDKVRTQADSVESEVRMLSQLRHPSVIVYYGAVFDSDKMQVKLFMELVHGGSLAAMVLSLEGRMRESLVRKFMRQIIEGLAFMHGQGVVHRDLKCENVLIDTNNGSVKLTDFGTAKNLSNVSDSWRAAKTMVGTPLFMAPEVIAPSSGDAEQRDDDIGYGKKADVWSLGILFGEMLDRGKMPWPKFVGPGHAFMYINSAEGIPTVPSGISAEAAALMRRCCVRDPNCRATAAELLNDPFFSMAAPLSPVRRNSVPPRDASSRRSSLGEESKNIDSGVFDLPPE